MRKNLPLYVVAVITGMLYVYHFDYNTLGSWDEAWYGSIAREMIRGGDWLRMNWNGAPFADHPPMGIWMIALSYRLFGISEFSTRLPSIIAGVLTSVIMYLTAFRLTRSRSAGVMAAMILATCVWYVIRVRSGNLDSLFVFCYAATIYMALRSYDNIRWFPLCMAFFGSLLLTKTLVGLSAAPLIGLCVIGHFRYIIRTWIWFLIGCAVLGAVVIPWYYINWHWYPDFYQHHFITIGTRDKSFDSYLRLNAEQPLFYLHMGIRKWYWIWVAVMSYLVIFIRIRKKELAFLMIWNVLVLYPFLTSEQTQIWHLIPVYIPVALIIAVGLHDAVNVGCVITKYTLSLLKFKNISLYMPSKQYLHIVAVCGIVLIAGVQLRIFRQEVFPEYRYIPDDVNISIQAGLYDKTVYLDDDYLPIAVFYSGRFMKQMAYEPEERKTLVNLFKSSEQDFIVITRNWALNNLIEAGLSYKILKQNASFSIVARK